MRSATFTYRAMNVLIAFVAVVASSTQLAAQRAPQADAPKTQPELATDIHETVVAVPVTVALLDGGKRSGKMIITHFKPATGDGPFPLVVMNHGRKSSERSEPARFRSLGVTRYWVRRGFAVIVPTRMGYGATGIDPDTESSGSSCNERSYATMSEAAAHQIATAIAFGKTLPWIDKTKIIIMGQSVGGLAATVANANNHAGVIAAINSAGGSGGDPIGRPGKPCAPERLSSVFAAAGKTAKTPMLWFYSQNDQYWGASLPRTWHKAYTAAGAKADFVMLPASGDDGHKQIDNLASWRPTVDAFISKLGFNPPAIPNAPAPTNFAVIGDASKLPHVKTEVKSDGYAKFLALDLPRAFVIAPTGNWAYFGGPDSLQRALKRCQEAAKQPCKPYAVDDAVVWTP